ncbi:MAG: DUF6768 family protein [Pseudomonadota bacterium]
MTQFDETLRDALSADDKDFLKTLENDQGMFEQMGATFVGPMKYWTAFAFVLSLIFFGLTIYCFYQMATVEGDRAALMWFAGFIWSAIAVAAIKIWFWLRMNHLATLRELKKIELMLA